MRAGSGRSFPTLSTCLRGRNGQGGAPGVSDRHPGAATELTVLAAPAGVEMDWSNYPSGPSSGCLSRWRAWRIGLALCEVPHAAFADPRQAGAACWPKVGPLVQGGTTANDGRGAWLRRINPALGLPIASRGLSLKPCMMRPYRCTGMAGRPAPFRKMPLASRSFWT